MGHVAPEESTYATVAVYFVLTMPNAIALLDL